MAERHRCIAALALAGVVLVGACSSEPPDPAEERRDRATERFEASFSGRQTECILDRLAEATLIAIDASGQLGEDSDELADLSEALRVCVVGEPDDEPAGG